MNINEAINIIKEQVSLCEQNREMFDLPDISDAKVEINDLPIKVLIYSIGNVVYFRSIQIVASFQ